MTSNKDDKEAFVWTWLPDETTPVVAGKLQKDNENIFFHYANSYLKRIGAISIYAIIQGENIEDALNEAMDCLEEAIAHRISKKLDIPAAQTL